MKHSWLLVLACAWILWSTEFSSWMPKEGYKWKWTCEIARKRMQANWVKARKLDPKDFLGQGAFWCFPSDFDPRGK